MGIQRRCIFSFPRLLGGGTKELFVKRDSRDLLYLALFAALNHFAEGLHCKCVK